MMRIARLFLLIAVCTMIMPPVTPNAEEFSPTPLKISCSCIIMAHDNSAPFYIDLENRPASVILAIYSDDRTSDGLKYSRLNNGYLGWHYINKIDTCVYCSPVKHCDVGRNIMVWNCDYRQYFSGGQQYVYYLHAFDTQSVDEYIDLPVNIPREYGSTSSILMVDSREMPLANPVWYSTTDRWVMGLGEEGYSTTELILGDGWTQHGKPLVDPYHPDDFYISVLNRERQVGSIQKYMYVPNGAATLDTDWGEEYGYASEYETTGNGFPGVATDGTYLFTIAESTANSEEAASDFYIYDYDGYMIMNIDLDLSPWWSSTDDYDKGGLLNGGPTYMSSYGENIVLSSHCSCLLQMINPAHFMNSKENEDLLVWSNGNGDYFHDVNFEETAHRPWVCNDETKTLFSSGATMDWNKFSFFAMNDNTPLSFGVLGPDGTGLGYFSLVKQNNNITSVKAIQNETAFDGLYAVQNNGDSSHIYYYGYDTLTGVVFSHYFDGYYYHPIELSYPNGGEVYTHGQKIRINWDMECYHENDKILLEFSSDGGDTWQLIIQDYFSENASNYLWSIPDIISDQCFIRLRVENYSDEYYIHTHEEPFSIVYADADHPDLQQFYHMDFPQTGNSMSVMIPADTPPTINGVPLDYSDNIGIFTPRGLCAGVGMWTGDNLAVTVWGNGEHYYSRHDGFAANEPLFYKIYDLSEGTEHVSHPVYAEGENVYETDGLRVLQTLSSTPRTFTLPLAKGWNTVSLPVGLHRPGLGDVFGDNVSHLTAMKDGDGNLFWPAYGVDYIDEWDLERGYMLHADEAFDLVCEGDEVFAPDLTYFINSGWRLLSFVGPDGLHPSDAFSAVADRVKVVKDADGTVWWPEQGIDDLAGMYQGRGYWIYADTNIAFSYPAHVSKSLASASPQTAPTHFAPVANTGSNATLLIPDGIVSAGGSLFGAGDEIGVFSRDGVCAGARVINGDEAFTVTLWGDNTMTQAVDGLTSGETFRIVFWDRETDAEYEVSATYDGGIIYSPNALLIAESLMIGNVDVSEESPATFSLSQNRPNPFNPTTSIPFTLPKEGRVVMTVYDITGRRVATLADGVFAAGAHEIMWDASGMASGVYICRLEAAGMVKTAKMTLAK